LNLRVKSAVAIGWLSAMVIAVSSCSLSLPDSLGGAPASSAPTTDVADVTYQGIFPYHPLVYHLDLSILAYQLYDQSLVWPFDPHYEELSGEGDQRKKFMNKVHNWAVGMGSEQVTNRAGIRSYRGPGALSGFPHNLTHDPILFDYSQVVPRRRSLSNSNGRWTEYRTPEKITATIKDTFVCYRPTNAAASTSTLARVPQGPRRSKIVGSNSLLTFEGGTGDKGEQNQPASQSIMGFVLLREKDSGAYDIHIAFRGSRSGDLLRAAIQALSDSRAKGNPDWITDLGYDRLSSDQGVSHISSVGKVHRGFARSMQSIYPNLFRCLSHVAKLKPGAYPDNIYVTGHSLGGALAQAFVSGVLMGNTYGPNGRGKAMPTALSKWPWRQIKLVSFSAPRIGDAEFARVLTVDRLQSEQFSSRINPVDRRAFRPSNRLITGRLLDVSRPAGFRVLHSKDPVTTEKGAGGKHVGKTVYVNEPKALDIVSPPDPSAHEQKVVRDLLLKDLNDSTSPRLAMQYLEMNTISPDYDKRNKGSPGELSKLAASIKRYYASNGIAFESAALDRNLKLRLTIANQP